MKTRNHRKLEEKFWGHKNFPTAKQKERKVLNLKKQFLNVTILKNCWRKVLENRILNNKNYQ